jgi:hypothetical protein
MVRSSTRTGLFVSSKVDDRGRNIFTFEIDQAQYDELEHLAVLSKNDKCYRCWFRIEASAAADAIAAAPDVFESENAGKMYLKFSKIDITPLPVLEKGKMYTIVYRARWFSTKDLSGISCSLNAVM